MRLCRLQREALKLLEPGEGAVADKKEFKNGRRQFVHRRVEPSDLVVCEVSRKSSFADIGLLTDLLQRRGAG